MNKQELKDKIFDKAWEENRDEYLIKLEDLFEILDDFETLSQEWIDEHAQGGWDEYILIEDLENLSIPRQEKPVVPKFVGEYIDHHKNITNLSEIMCAAQIEAEEYSTGERKNMDTIFGWIIINQNLFARAWLDGYTIEEEPKFYAVVKGGDLLSEEKYWNLWLGKGTLEIGDNTVHPDVADEYIFKTTKEEWNELGINDTNADFEEVDTNG